MCVCEGIINSLEYAKYTLFHHLQFIVNCLTTVGETSVYTIVTSLQYKMCSSYANESVWCNRLEITYLIKGFSPLINIHPNYQHTVITVVVNQDNLV